MKKGDKVNINPNGKYPNQGLDENNKPLTGIILRENAMGYDFEVQWSNGDEYLYDEKDLILLDQSQDYEVY